MMIAKASTRVLALLLAACMVLGLSSMTASGEETSATAASRLFVSGSSSYCVGDELTFTALYAYTDQGMVDLLDASGRPVEGVTITGVYDMNTVKDGTRNYYEITLSYGGASQSFRFNVKEPEVLSSGTEGVTITGSSAGITNVAVSANTDSSLADVAADLGAREYVAFDLSGAFASSGHKATVTIDIPADWTAGILQVYHLDGAQATAYEDVDSDPNTYTFVTNHFSTWMLTSTPRAASGDTGGTETPDDPYAGLETATDYPEYPDDGAVRINKTATHDAEEFLRTGVTRVELAVAGISVKHSVNVILVMDISNSMSWDDSSLDYNDTEITAGSSQRMNIAKTSANAFIETLLAPDESGEMNNTISILAFAGIDSEYNTHSTASANDDVYQVGNLTMTDIDEAKAAIDSLTKAKTGGTNYDYAFQSVYQMAAEIYAKTGNEVHVVFMTDGVPTHYNGVYYKSRSNTDLTAGMQYADPATGALSYYTSTGYDRNGNSIDYTETQQITIYYSDGTTQTKNVTYNKGWSDFVMNNRNGWAEKVKALDYVAKVYSIGFGLQNGSVTQGATTSMPTLNNNGGQYYIPSSVTKALLEHICSTTEDFYEADNETELKALYASLANKIRYAGTKAQVTDIMGGDFDLQMASSVLDKNGEPIALQTPPSITIKTYDLYPKGTLDAQGNDLTGQRIGTYEELETITFSADGTEAYSTQKSGNILTRLDDGTILIEGLYVSYTLDGVTGKESLDWTIGSITDKEIALAFDAYLAGSTTGDAQKDIYETNENALLEYVDINGDYATQTFPVPVVSWGGASTTIHFYLVDAQGRPVNRHGEVVPMANCIYVGDPVTVELNLNADLTIQAHQIQASAYVPDGFFLYDYNAYYIVETTSGAVSGGITVSEPSADAYKTTGTAPNAITQTGAQTTYPIRWDEEYYTWSDVGFGVRYDLTSEEVALLGHDQVVLDYGKTIQTDVLANDYQREGYTRELVGFVQYDAEAALNLTKLNPGSPAFTTDNGEFSVADGKVQFQLSRMLSEVQKVFYVVKFSETVNAQNYYYVWGQLDLIPATSVYYETDFVDGLFQYVQTDEVKTTDRDYGTAGVVDWITEGTSAHDLQDDGLVGCDQTYGFDSSYADDSHLSNGSSRYVEGEGLDHTYVTFSFVGTGFDLFSRTGAEQGQIRVEVYADAAMQTKEKAVNVLNKSESNLELYQIPVVSIQNLSYGTHYVRIAVAAGFHTDDAFLETLNRGNQFYFDAIRVYDPALGNGEAEAAYAQDHEANVSVDEVRALILAAGDSDVSTGEVEGVSFVDRSQGSVDIGDYANIGPNNEVYISKSNAIVFKLSWTGTAASIDIGAKTIAGDNARMKAYISGSSEALFNNQVVDVNIGTATAQFYSLVDGDNMAAFSGLNSAYVMITNEGEGVLSITDIKVTFTEGGNTVRYTVDQNVMAFANNMLTASEAPAQTNYDILSATVTSETSLTSRKSVLTVTTYQDVAQLQITQGASPVDMDSVAYVDKADGTRIWTVTITGWAMTMRSSYAITGIAADGTMGNTLIVSGR